MELIKAGEKAPDFALKDQNGEEVKLSDYKGKKLLIAFHPLAWTSVCLDQMRDIEKNYDTIKEKNACAVGISVDPQPSKSAWAKAICLEDLKILSDFNPVAEMSKSYGSFLEKINASGRAAVIVDEEGIVSWSKEYDPSSLPDIQEILDNL